MHYGIDFGFLTRKAPPPKCYTIFRSLRGGPHFPNPHTPGVRKWTVTHSASGFWRHHLLHLSAWLVCSPLPGFIRVLKSTVDSEEHDITQFFGKCLTFYGNPGLMMPFIHQTERTNKAVFSAIEDDPTPLPPACFAMKFEVWRDTYVTIGIVQNSSPVYSGRYKTVTVDEIAQKISCEYCVFSFLLSTCKASNNNLSCKNELATFVTTYPHFLMSSASDPEESVSHWSVNFVILLLVFVLPNVSILWSLIFANVHSCNNS